MKPCRELPRKDDNKAGTLRGPAVSGSGKDTEGSAQREHLHGSGLLTGFIFHQAGSLISRELFCSSFHCLLFSPHK